MDFNPRKPMMLYRICLVVFLSACAVEPQLGERPLWSGERVVLFDDSIRPEQRRAFLDGAAEWGIDAVAWARGRPVNVVVVGLPGGDEALGRAWWGEEPQRVGLNVRGYWDFPERAWRETSIHEWGHLIARCDDHLPRLTGIMSSPHHGDEVTDADWELVEGCQSSH